MFACAFVGCGDSSQSLTCATVKQHAEATPYTLRDLSIGGPHAFVSGSPVVQNFERSGVGAGHHQCIGSTFADVFSVFLLLNA